ncbi:MAG: histidine kinase [Gemmatimonadaceae bacterium]|jgi:anti-sigma regulatory factor (Ser/Thr protein kinase)|nr:histidine kinase [Gemmatimonadaceae bacterium]
MARGWFWWQLLIGWLPIWALFVALLVTAHPDVSAWTAVGVATRMALAGAALGPLVARVVRRLPWLQPVRLTFVSRHLVAACAYALAWLALNVATEYALTRRFMMAPSGSAGPYLVMGALLYIMTAGVLYATDASARAARAELSATQAQLATLRAQLNPHFLFNALHTVVQLTPEAPERATRAAEDLAALLRTTIEEDRDLVTLAEEWAVVSKYLDLERLRFEERLQVTVDLAPDAREALVPAFAVQTLVENAVRHGAAPRVAPTTIAVRARTVADGLEITVHDDGVGMTAARDTTPAGTGLRRLRERLAALYGDAGWLTVESLAQGVRATVHVPRVPSGADS